MISILLVATDLYISVAQTPLKHEKKIFVSPDGKVYVNKFLPIYLKISASPDANAISYTLPSVKTAKYANPMYFDTEGRNTFLSPWAVDTVTKKPVVPKILIQFEVYADGKPPVTHLNIKHAHKYIKNGEPYFDKDVVLEFSAMDEVSGTEATYISIDHGNYMELSKMVPSFDKEKEYVISYYSVDRVGNVEKPKTEKFHLDRTPPKTSFKIIGESKGKVLSSKASISLSSTDSLSGVNKIVYSINDGPEKLYYMPIPISLLNQGKSKISYYAIDNVGNKEDAKIIATSSGTPDESEQSSAFSFYIDKEPPVVNYEIVGDQSNGKYLYISSRSEFKINATDDKSGVDKVTYSINYPLLDQTYTEPFKLKGTGLQTVFFTASDNVGNLAMPKSQVVYIDNSVPKTSLSINGRSYSNRDTTFITSETKIVLYTSETGSGVKALYYSIDGGSKSLYSVPVTFQKEGFHSLEYFAVDNVNNTEETRKRSFFVDNIPPVIHYHFSVKAIGEKTIRNEKYTIYPSNAMLYIAATDNATGGNVIDYTINGKPKQNLIPVKGLVPGNYEIVITAYDMLWNKSSETILFSIEN